MTSLLAPVLVVGAGPSGLAVAVALLRNGIPVRIIDKEPHHRIGQRASGIWPRTLEVFHFLDIPEIYQRSIPAQIMRQYKPGSLELFKDIELVQHNDPTPSIPYNNPRFFGQPALEGVLRSHLEKYGCTVELNTELLSFEQEDDRVLAKLVKHSDGQEVSEKFEASYLIGADGAKGVCRKQLGLTFLGETRDEMNCVLGDICLNTDVLDREHWHFFGDMATNSLSLRPTDHIALDGFQFVLTVKDYDPNQLVADEKLLYKCMSDVMDHEINVRKVMFLSTFRPSVRMVDKFGYGRAFVVGDAAHVHSPVGGQGLNSCVQDALNLAWKLSLVCKGLSSPTLLDSYNAERLPVIAEMLNITTGILVKATQPGGLEHAMRREKKLNMLGVNYRASSIVIDEITNAEPVNAYGVLNETVLVAGDRAPDAPGLVVLAEAGTETRLFDRFKATHHTVLMFGPDVTCAQHIIDVSSSYPRDVVQFVVVLPQGATATECPSGAEVVVDAAGHAYRAYLVENGDARVVVVRPDGVIGAIVRGAQGVKVYFEKIFL